MAILLTEDLRPTAAPTTFADDDARDAALAASAQAGDLHAFSLLYDRHHDRLVRFCRSRLGDADDAADAAQETFLRAWRALDTFGNRGSFYPWLHAIARNVCTDTLRKRLQVETSDDRALGSLADTGASANDLLDAQSDTALLHAALDRLSARHREILALREYEGWTYERIADAEKLELNAVKSLVWRARQALRREFLSLSADGRFGGFLGLGLLVRRTLPAVRRSVERLAYAASEVTAAGSAAAGTAGAAAAGAVTVAAVAAGVATAPLPAPPAPPAPAIALAAPTAHTARVRVALAAATAVRTAGDATATPLAPVAGVAPTTTEAPGPAVTTTPTPSTTSTTTPPTAAPSGTAPTSADGGSRSVPVASEAPASRPTTWLAAVGPGASASDDKKASDDGGKGKAKAATDTTRSDAPVADAAVTDTKHGADAVAKGNGGASNAKSDNKPDNKPDTKVDGNADGAKGNGGGGSKVDAGNGNGNSNSKKK